MSGDDPACPGPEAAPGTRSGLTLRERAVLQALADGLTPTEIAARLRMTPESVEDAIETACRRLGATDATDAVIIALRLGEVLLG